MQPVLVGVLALGLAVSSAHGQRTRARVSSLERTGFELDASGRGNPGFDFRGDSSDRSLDDVDLDNVDVRALINLLKEAISETERLYRSLRRDAQRSRELAGSLSEVRKLRTGASYIVQDLEDGRSLERLLPVIRELSSDWRLLSHQLGQAPRVSRQTLDIVNRIDGQARRMEKMFRLAPQLDRRSLVNELARLQITIENLVQELQYDSRRRNDTITYDARKLAQQVRQVRDLVLDGASYERTVSEYTRFVRMWEVLLKDLRSVDNRYIQRHIRNISDTDSRIHDLLWLERTTNRERLKQLADTLMRDVDEFFSRTPLRLVVDLKNVDSILDTAGDFYGTVQHFKQTVSEEEDEKALMESYTYVEQYGNEFIRAFAPLRSEAGRVVLREIEDSIASLRAELHIGGTVTSVDSRKLIDTAATLDNLADHLRFDVRNWLNRDRQAWREDALETVDRFALRCREMHRLLQKRPKLTELRRESEALNQVWSEVNQFLVRCRTEDREHIDYLRRDINAALYELEAPLAL